MKTYEEYLARSEKLYNQAFDGTDSSVQFRELVMHMADWNLGMAKHLFEKERVDSQVAVK